MYIKNILSASGLPGLYRLVNNRSNGLILENISDGKKIFASARRHQFSPLESIGIYTYEDTIELSKVLETMHLKSIEQPPPSKKSSVQELTDYFALIVPDYDRDMVKIGDIKRLIGWYHVLVESKYHLKSDEEE